MGAEVTDEEKVTAINYFAVMVSLRSLYDTHVEGEEPARLRGEAIQAVNRLAEALGKTGAIEEIQSEPHSMRRRNSPIWNSIWPDAFSK